MCFATIRQLTWIVESNEGGVAEDERNDKDESLERIDNLERKFIAFNKRLERRE